MAEALIDIQTHVLIIWDNHVSHEVMRECAAQLYA